jgi:hypothetical protein
MKSNRARSIPMGAEGSSADVEAFVGAVLRSHDGVLRNLRRLAAGTVWPVEGDARRDRDIIDLYTAR